MSKQNVHTHSKFKMLVVILEFHNVVCCSQPCHCFNLSIMYQIMFPYLQRDGIEIWARPITPVYQSYFSYAVAFLNRRTDGTPSDVAVTLRELGLSNPGGYSVDVRYCRVKYLELQTCS